VRGFHFLDIHIINKINKFIHLISVLNKKDGIKMGLLETWREKAYNQEMSKQDSDLLWAAYFNVEKEIYEQLLTNIEVVEGTVAELAEKYQTDISTMTGFLDGIDESLKNSNSLEENLQEDSKIVIDINPEKLYYNMVAAKAEWLYNLPQWDSLLTESRRKELYKEQKLSGTVVKGEKIGRNDPCPCGSGKKYKKCCGK